MDADTTIAAPRGRFGELRSRLHLPPSQAVWREILALLEIKEDDSLPQGLLPYLAHHLQRWPDALRQLPPRWIEQALVGQAPQPALILCRQAHLERLGLGPPDIARLAQLPQLRQLRHLSLASNVLGPPGCQRLAENSHLEQVLSLDLGSCNLDQASVATIAQSALGQRLSGLAIWGNELDHAALQPLLESPLGSQIEHLNLRINKLDPRAAELLARHELPALRNLDLAFNAIQDQGLYAILESPWLTTLEHLDLSDNRLQGEAIAALVDSPLIARLRSLRLENNRFDRQAWRALLRSEHLDDAIKTRFLNPSTSRKRSAREAVSDNPASS